MRGRAGSGPAVHAQAKPVAADIEPHDAVHALGGEPHDAALARHRLGVVPAARGERLPVVTKHRRHFGIRDAGGPDSLIDDAAAQPISLVGHGEEFRAVALDADRRNAAEVRVRRRQLDAAAKGELAEPGAFRIARLERRDRPRAHFDLGGRFRRARIGLRGDGERERRQQRESERCASQDQCIFRRGGARTGSGGPCSSNSSASFSVITPPSSSASTMVTARR